MKIKAFAKIEDVTIKCNGEIDIHWINEPQAYVTWKLYDNTGLLASKSENYLFRNNVDTEDSLIDRVIKKIENFRIGRKKVFKKVEVIK